MAQSKQVSIGVSQMTCAACSSRVENELNKLKGVEAKVNLMTEVATVDYDPAEITGEEIANQLQKIGYPVKVKEIELDILGMTCAACANRIEKMLSALEGVGKVSVNLTTETDIIEYDDGFAEEKQFI